MIASLGRWQSRYKIYKLAWHSTGYQGFHLYLVSTCWDFLRGWAGCFRNHPTPTTKLGHDIDVPVRLAWVSPSLCVNQVAVSELSWTTKSVEKTASLKIQTAHGFARESRSIWQTDLAVVLANQGTCLNQRILSKPSQSMYIYNYN